MGTSETTSSAADAVFLVRPAAFGANPETAATNAFQARTSDVEPAVLAARARAELDGLAAALRAAGVQVVVVDDTPSPPKPDAVFPNNWISFHADGTVVLYPMLAPARRAEVRHDVVARIAEATGARWPRCVDLSGLADSGAFLEGTGSLVLDRASRVAYACRSPRTTPEGLEAWSRVLGYAVHAFDACDADGRPYYHTNVCMSLGARWALSALEAVDDVEERAALRARLEASGRELLALSRAQVADMAANVLELRAAEGRTLIALSTRARDALGRELCARLAAHGTLVAVPFDTIETIGGGSVRCAIAAVHTPAASR